ncbi:RnfH family protein [Tropicimonas sp. IMCC34043]|uniref:RnfH family protein n=1 Tax=Tropicimonas sp. IMCC34043 TaxID=2248760 RepID=UPI000E2847AD|nr:RnfH family protein [Tropicimonas sp. IMCC34043]
MNVGVAYAKQSAQAWIKIEVPEGSSVEQVIELSGLLQQFPEIDLAVNKVGIFGSVAKLTATVKDGDRVEIYRPIHPEAELLERRDAKAQA